MNNQQSSDRVVMQLHVVQDYYIVCVTLTPAWTILHVSMLTFLALEDLVERDEEKKLSHNELSAAQEHTPQP